MKRNLLIVIGLIGSIIVNVYAQDVQHQLVEKAVMDYADGFYSGNYDRIENVLHTELNKFLVYKLPQSEKTFLDYASVSNLIEYASGNSGFIEKDKRNIQIDVLSILGDIAVARLHSIQFISFSTFGQLDTIFEDSPEFSGKYFSNNDPDNRSLIIDY